MYRYILRRLLWAVPTLLVVITLSFMLIRFSPGSPFSSERNIGEAQLAALRARYHYDKPLYEQYFRYLGSVLTGDLGPSVTHPGQTVNDRLRAALPVSIQLGLLSLAVAILLGAPAGVIAAVRHNKWQDYAAMSAAMIGISVPSFVSGPILILIFAVSLRWFHTSGWETWNHMVLPALALGSRYSAYIARLTRAGMLETLRQDHVRTARAKGLSAFVVVWRHCLRGALLPLVSYLGPAAAGIITGTVIVEKIFAIPGMGKIFVDAALNRDLFVVLGVVIVYSTILIAMNLVVDVVYGILDPRVRYE